MLIVLCIDSVCHCIISGASVLSSVKQKLGGVLLLRVDGEEAPNSMPTFFFVLFLSPHDLSRHWWCGLAWTFHIKNKDHPSTLNFDRKLLDSP